MKKSILPSEVDGVIYAPPSKSAAQRALAIASLCDGESVLHHVGSSDDVLATIRVCQSLGAAIVPANPPSTDHKKQSPRTQRKAYHAYTGKLFIRGGIRQPKEILDCGESGLCLRMFSGIAAALDFPLSLTGSKSLAKRPVSIIEKALASLGIECLAENGRLPLKIKGPVRGGEASLDASDTSQLLSGILIAAPLFKNDLLLNVSKLLSKPYIDLTLGIMRRFGVSVDHDDYRQFAIHSKLKYGPAEYQVEGDWSGAAFMLVAGAVAGNVRVKNLDGASAQADLQIVEVLRQAGAPAKHLPDGSFVVEKQPLKPFRFDATDCPDLFPPLAVLAANCNGESQIIGTERLHSKESNRAATLADLLTRLGIKIHVDNNIMYIRGGRIKAADVHAHGDHRIAMAAAIAALNAEGPVNINGANAVNKSYPDFFNDLETLCTV